MKLSFKNGKFKIMQIADIQESYPLNPDTVKLIDLALEREQPDLVVLTGDQVQGYSQCFKKDTHTRYESTVDTFMEPIVKRNIPFCLTFGNHDDDCVLTKSEILAMYEKYPNFVRAEEADRLDEGTFSLQIKGSDGADVLAIYLLDSEKKGKDGNYAPMPEHRIAWLKAQKAKNAYLPAVLFQHIPFPEYFDVLEKCGRFQKGAIEAFKSRKNTFYRLPDMVKGDLFGEVPGCPEAASGEFAEIKKDGDIFAVWVGHDHINSFKRQLDGIDIGYTQGAGFNTYGPGAERGVRIFTFDESDVRAYETYTVTMGELCDFKPSQPLKEFVFVHAPTSVYEVVSKAKKIAVVGGAIIVGAMIVKRFK